MEKRPTPDIDELVRATRALGASPGVNLVAFSGGVDSSLVAWLVKAAFGPEGRAVIGVSPSLPRAQLEMAREVARFIGIPLAEVVTREGELPGYVANNGQACYFCKTTLYHTLTTLGRSAAAEAPGRQVVLFNGTNHDDFEDPTRVGLRAAEVFRVASPLAHLTKAEVRAAARRVGLPNADHAASPCLRSRLAYGVEATPERLARVEAAEGHVRRVLGLGPRDDLRVRTLEGERAIVEVDALHLPDAQAARDALEGHLQGLGFHAVEVRAFRTGSLSRPA